MMCNCGWNGCFDIIVVGAENTKVQRLTAPDISGFVLSTAFAGGSREYKTRMGNTCWPTGFGFFSHPVHSFSSSQKKFALYLCNTGLKSRRIQKGSIAMFSAPLFSCSLMPLRIDSILKIERDA